jgi:hypothetical protein
MEHHSKKPMTQKKSNNTIRAISRSRKTTEEARFAAKKNLGEEIKYRNLRTKFVDEIR